MYLQSFGLFDDKIIDKKMKEIISQLETKLASQKVKSYQGDSQKNLIRGALFLLCGMQKLKKEYNLKNESKKKHHGIPIFPSFNTGIVTKAALFGESIIFRSIHLPSASVIERFNSLLEEPRSLILIEDTQKIYNDFTVLNQLRKGTNKELNRSIPIIDGFSIAATTNETGYIMLSKALQSRFQYIRSDGYNLQVNNNQNDIHKLLESISKNDEKLISEIIALSQKLSEKFININSLEFIRFATSAYILSTSISSSQNIKSQACGIAALRAILDSRSIELRKKGMQQVLQSYYPQKELPYIVVSETTEKPVFPNPITFNTKDRVFISTVSGVRIKVSPKADFSKLDHINMDRIIC